MSIEISQKIDAVGKQILSGARNELYLNMRFLDLALSSLNYVMNVKLTLYAKHLECGITN